VSSGTMSNTLALLSQTNPGDEVILDRRCHIFNYEVGAASVLGGLQLFPMDGPGGLLPLDALPGAVRPDNIHHPRTSLVSIENTHNRAGGKVYPYDQIEEVSRFARGRGLRFHMDGARLANASVKTGIPFERYGALADSITFCFSKGLGAPVGSILVSDAVAVAKARVWRKRLGGGMRQVGILAAAGIVALEQMTKRLGEDHSRARNLAEGLSQIRQLVLDAGTPATNMVFMNLADDVTINARLVADRMKEYGVLVGVVGERRFRLVTHYWIDDLGVENALSGFRKVLAK